jgi:transposase-like protein
MNQERNLFLENDDDNKANGYYERSLNIGSFKLNINVPIDRKGKFRPQILPDHYKSRPSAMFSPFTKKCQKSNVQGRFANI